MLNPINLALLPLRIARGAVNKLIGGGDDTPSDPTLKAKVESELYRQPGVSRSNVNITVADGLVTLHGTASDPAQIARIQTAVRGIAGVEHLESELHVPSKPAPRPATTRKRKPAPAKLRPGVSADPTAEGPGVPPPAEIAARHEGRPPAPFGSTENDS